MALKNQLNICIMKRCYFNPKHILFTILFVVLSKLSMQAQIDYFGEVPPGNIPKIFAPGIISQAGRFEARLVYSPDGKEIFFATVSDKASGKMSIMTSRKKGSAWTPQVVAPFSGNDWDFEPCYSPDGNRLYFTSKRQYGYFKLWYINRINDTLWSEPVCVPNPVNTTSDELFSMPLNDSSFYFVSDRPGGYGGKDLYFVKYDATNQSFKAKGQPVNLGNLINTTAYEFDPCPGPNGDYIIFMRNGDLYICFRKADSSFTDPKSMENSINTVSTEVGATITPDKKYLMFTRFSNNSNAEIYWVSLSVVDSLR